MVHDKDEEAKGFGKSVPMEEQQAMVVAISATPYTIVNPVSLSCKQFWKAGDYEGTSSGGVWEVSAGGFDHVRVHPRFLHSNATIHKWALGAFAELLDNALDEVRSGATYVYVDMINIKKYGSRMVLIEDNRDGMNSEKMQKCMSLGYSAKSKLVNTIGQYGNGFKTSTMRLGGNVIVFSRCREKDGDSVTQTIGLLSYTFLKSTGKEDIVVQMFNLMKDHGTRIIIYNLWEDEQGQLELDFDSDPHDIQLRGVNRDEKSISMATQFPNSRHFLIYMHSLKSYASILYLRVPPAFRIILRGRDVEHHNIVNDMMHIEQSTYRPQEAFSGLYDFSNMPAVVTIGFVKDAKHHLDVQGFNVYHKNRLIKPFWRLWNSAGSAGRGFIGVLEANFVEPAHDKQGFEPTPVLGKLEARLVHMQKTYWRSNCQEIGYCPVEGKKYVKKSNKRAKPEGACAVQVINIDDDSDYNSSPERNVSDLPQPSSELPTPRSGPRTLRQLEQENEKLKDSLDKKEGVNLALQDDLRREKEIAEIQITKDELAEMKKEQDNLLEIVAEERDRFDKEEEELRKNLEEASNTIQALLDGKSRGRR